MPAEGGEYNDESGEPGGCVIASGTSGGALTVTIAAVGCDGAAEIVG